MDAYVCVCGCMYACTCVSERVYLSARVFVCVYVDKFNVVGKKEQI